MSIPVLPGLRDFVSDYDGLILDLWGVIHDGNTAYPGVADTLRALKEAGKKTMLLSNAPRRFYALEEGMTRMGIPRELYGEVMSSGEAVHQELTSRRDPFYAALGRKCHHMGPERDRSVFDGLDLDIVPVEEADFILNTGPIDFDETIADYQPALEAGIRRGIPMVCANPDHVVLREGKPIMCAGAMAARYEEMGGKVSYRGKPDPAIYAICLDRLALPRNKVLCVGDAFHTDIAGANSVGLDSLLCTGGIHGSELGVTMGQMADPARVAEAARHHGQRPSAAIPAFVW